MRGLNSTIDGISDAVDKLLGVVGDQFERELIGFLVLAIGLVMLFIGGVCISDMAGLKSMNS